MSLIIVKAKAYLDRDIHRIFLNNGLEVFPENSHLELVHGLSEPTDTAKIMSIWWVRLCWWGQRRAGTLVIIFSNKGCQLICGRNFGMKLGRRLWQACIIVKKTIWIWLYYLDKEPWDESLRLEKTSLAAQKLCRHGSFKTQIWIFQSLPGFPVFCFNEIQVFLYITLH